MEEETITPTAPDVAPTNINELKPKMQLTGIVKRLELYGAFIDVGVGVNALVHISKLSDKRVNRVADALKVDEEVNVWVDRVDPEKNQIMVTMVEPNAVDWQDLKTGQSYSGTITRLETYGAFINIGAEREGLVHISEISHEFIKSPSDSLQVGQEVDVQVLGFSKRKRRIDLSIKNLLEKPESAQRSSEPKFNQAAVMEMIEAEEAQEDMPTAMEMALRKAMGDDSINALPSARRKKKKGRNKRYRRERRQSREDMYSRTLQYQTD